MAFSRTVFQLVVSALCLASCVSSGRVPVFIWGDVEQSSVRSNPLAKVSAEEFRGVLKQELANDPFTVVFIEETLSVEDFSKKSIEGASSFPYLHESIGRAVYLPSVDAPVRVLNKIADPAKVDHVKLTENGLTAEIQPESGNFLFITLKDAKEGETRAELLRRHNDFMQEMVSKLQEKNSDVVAIYTAHFPSWIVVDHHRVRRQASSASGEYELDGLLLYVSNLSLNDGNRTVELSTLTGRNTSFNGTEMEATLNFGTDILKLYFYKTGGYWFFNKVELTESSVTEELTSTAEVYALEGFSYRCADTVSFASVNATKQYTLKFVDMKVQPFFETGNSSELVFGDSFNCVGFFSVPIWSGLFVVFILLAITFFGIMMMMDIRTMDRFDDPKGKTITINASE